MREHHCKIPVRLEIENTPPITVEVDVRFNLDAMAAELASRAVTNESMVTFDAGKRSHYSAKICKNDKPRFRAWRKLNATTRDRTKIKITIEQPA